MLNVECSSDFSSSSFFPSSSSSLAGFSSRPGRNRDEAAFTLIEIAISLAIIAFALVAIIGVLPIGLNVQRDNREETVINHDATMLMDAIRSGARGFDDLTNYVMAITNYWEHYDGLTNRDTPPGQSPDWYTPTAAFASGTSLLIFAWIQARELSD
jgi:type II secretory pathway pseudopilin PulG